jgi:dihydroflavonol-4-reductase
LNNAGTVLVTGGTGFLGAYIIQQLIQKGYTVKATKRSNSVMPFFIEQNIIQQVQWVNTDVLDVVGIEMAMQNVQAVIHAAAIVSFNSKDAARMEQVNVEGTANLVNIAIDNNVKRFVHISSVAALGRTANGETVTDEKEWKDSKINTAYAISKRKAALEVWRGIGEGLPAVILNPSTIIGYGNWNNSSCAIFKNVYNQFPYYTNGVNGFVAVQDVANAAILLMETNITGEQFIINGDNWSFKKLLDTIATGLHKKKPDRHASAFMSQVAWRLEALKALFNNSKPLLTKETARIASSKTFFSNQKILAALPGFSFTPLQQSIEQACKHYLNNS